MEKTHSPGLNFCSRFQSVLQIHSIHHYFVVWIWIPEGQIIFWVPIYPSMVIKISAAAKIIKLNSKSRKSRKTLKSIFQKTRKSRKIQKSENWKPFLGFSPSTLLSPLYFFLPSFLPSFPLPPSHFHPPLPFPCCIPKICVKLFWASNIRQNPYRIFALSPR